MESNRGRLRVCIVTPFGERLGGSDSLLWTFLRHFDRDRLDPLVVFLDQGGFERDAAAIGVRTESLPGGRIRNPLHVGASILRLARILRRERPDLVLNWISTAHVYAGPAAALTGYAKRCAWWQQEPHRGRRIGRDRALDQLATLIPARAILANSSAVAAAQRGLRPRRAILRVLPGIEEPTPAPPPHLAALRAELRIPPDCPVVGIVGRLMRWKGHHRLLRALALLTQEAGPVYGLVVGGGGHRADPGYERELRDLAGALGIEDRVVFTGHVSGVSPYIELMDVLVNASAAEPFGLTLIEAMALRVPVVAVAEAGPAEIVEPGRSGVLVPSADPADLAAGIGELLADDAQRATIAAGGRERYLASFTAERMARELESRLEELAA